MNQKTSLTNYNIRFIVIQRRRRKWHYKIVGKKLDVHYNLYPIVELAPLSIGQVIYFDRFIFNTNIDQ